MLIIANLGGETRSFTQIKILDNLLIYKYLG